MDYFYDVNKFIIKGYDKKNTFASFLPGISGKYGKPIWSYYVNRGQVISSFGIRDKNTPILEFSPASIAYQTVQTQGFRTFLKVNGNYYEPFSACKDVERQMLIDESSVAIKEINPEAGYEITVKYFGLPNEDIAALVRRVEIKNISSYDLDIEVVDGLTTIIPVGVSNDTYKAVGNLMRSWMDVENLNNKVAFYRLRASSADQAEVSQTVDGHFFLSFVDGKLNMPVVDANLVFGYDNSLINPVGFINNGVEKLDLNNQVTANKVPCGFAHCIKHLGSKEVININSLYGYVEDVSIINQKVNSIHEDFFSIKEKEAYQVIRELTDDIDTKTSNKVFDEYCRQSYLDNFIRGGYPTLLDDGKEGIVYYLYSRKHGDLERDYNWFVISPEYYSQGNGNYRDANQNRRNDCLFKNYVGTYDIKQFMDLIQIDGYNPLSVNGVAFKVASEYIKDVIKKIYADGDAKLEGMLNKFTPGQIVNYIAVNKKRALVEPDIALREILNKAEYDFEANFGEGYWSDHWTYNFDLVENYLHIYPDKLNELMFSDGEYKYFQSPVSVLPRSEKYVLTKDLTVRQYGSINHHDRSKANKLGVDINATNWLKDSKGEIYKTNLFEKLLSLATIKFLTLDPMGLGIEMEGEKPGWNDAMNGLPGLFGSGLSESIELLRIVRFLRGLAKNKQNQVVGILTELNDLCKNILPILEDFYKDKLDSFNYWDKTTSLREEYRELTDICISGNKQEIKIGQYLHLLELMETKLQDGLDKAKEIGEGILPTYFIYEATDYEKVVDKNGNEVKSHYGLPKVKVKGFKLGKVPFFLEGPARSYKVLEKDEVLKMHKKIKKTDLYDKKLGLYKTSVDLDPQSLEMGRIRAFTKGWLERESCFLHMAYKYLWGLLKSELYDEFFEELNTGLVSFMDPEVYGRSVLENSSFIATSCNPDPQTHGRGFVSRLTGANVEFLSMWNAMMFGKNVFKYENGEISATFKPILSNKFFDSNDEVSAKFMSNTTVTYVNKNRKDTFKDCVIEKMIVDGQEIIGDKLSGELVLKLRDGSLRNIKIILI